MSLVEDVRNWAIKCGDELRINPHGSKGSSLLISKKQLRVLFDIVKKYDIESYSNLSLDVDDAERCEIVVYFNEEDADPLMWPINLNGRTINHIEVDGHEWNEA